MNTKTSKPFPWNHNVQSPTQGTQFSHGVHLRCTWVEAKTGQRQVGGKYSVFHRIPSPLAKIKSLLKHAKSISIPSLECQSLCQSWSNHFNTEKLREGPGRGDQNSNQLLERETAAVSVVSVNQQTNKQMDFRKRKTSHSLHFVQPQVLVFQKIEKSWTGQLYVGSWFAQNVLLTRSQRVTCVKMLN